MRKTCNGRSLHIYFIGKKVLAYKIQISDQKRLH